MTNTMTVTLSSGEFDGYIGRAGRGKEGYFGKPFPMGNGVTRQPCIQKYRRYFTSRIQKDTAFRERVLGLTGKRLGCFCKPQVCDGDVIANWLNTHNSESKIKETLR